MLAAAAITLVKDPTQRAGRPLPSTASDKKGWIVRAAGLNAIGLRGATSLVPATESNLQDQRQEVRYSMAAAVIHLTDLNARRAAPVRRASAKPAHKKQGLTTR